MLPNQSLIVLKFVIPPVRFFSIRIQDWEKAVVRKLSENWQLAFSFNPMANNTSYAELSVLDRVRVIILIYGLCIFDIDANTGCPEWCCNL